MLFRNIPLTDFLFPWHEVVETKSKEVTMETKSSKKKKVTAADLALIDGAIAMYRASLVTPTAGMIGVGVNSSDPIACDPVDVVALLVAAAIIAYKAYNSCLVGGVSEEVALAERLNIAPTVSLSKLIASRNNLAKAPLTYIAVCCGEDVIVIKGGLNGPKTPSMPIRCSPFWISCSNISMEKYW